MAEQYVDWGDVTVTVDPMHTKQWIFDGSDGHIRSFERGKALDQERVRELRNWIDHEPVHDISYTLPYNLPFALAHRENDDCGWRGIRVDTGRKGFLPSVTKLFYTNKLPNTDPSKIESAMREENRRAGHRLFDQSNF